MNQTKKEPIGLVDCSSCRPLLIDPGTKKPYPDDHPSVMIMNEVWSKTSQEIKDAWHRFCCQNSRARLDVIRAAMFAKAFEEACS